MIFQRQKMLFRQKIQSYGPDTNDFREFSIICKLNWERVWYFINNVLFNSKIVIFNQRTNRNEQNGTVHNSTWLIELRYRLILLEYIFIPAHLKNGLEKWSRKKVATGSDRKTEYRTRTKEPKSNRNSAEKPPCGTATIKVISTNIPRFSPLYLIRDGKTFCNIFYGSIGPAPSSR